MPEKGIMITCVYYAFFLLVILIELGNSVYIHLCYGIISTSFCQFACL